MKKSIYTILLSVFFITFPVACDDTKDQGKPDSSYETPIRSTGLTHNGCKVFASRNSLDEIVQVEAVGNNKLNIKHKDVMFNCEPGEISFTAGLTGSNIIILEKEKQSIANCTCPYDLEYTIELPAQGKYKMIINEKNFGEFEFNETTNITLRPQQK